MAITFQAGRNTSDAQAALMTRLVSESPKVAALVDTIGESMTEGKTRPIRTWTPREVRALIDLMIATSNTDPARVETRITPNRYAGACADCKGNVEVEAGRVRKENGRWVTRHLDGQCPPKATPVEPAARLQGSPEGFWTLDGLHFKVQLAVHGSGRPYAKVLDEDGTWTRDDRTRGVLARIQAGEATRMTKDEAGALGRLYGRCVACSATLTDETSIEVGMGPICRGKFA
jgi:hypothetical protein